MRARERLFIGGRQGRFRNRRSGALFLEVIGIFILMGLPGSPASNLFGHLRTNPAPDEILARSPGPLAAPSLDRISGSESLPPTEPVGISLPSECSTLTPADLVPWRPQERGMDVACSAAHLRLQLSGASAGAAPSANPTGFILYEMSMTYDAADGYVLLLGETVVGPQTWTYSHGAWTQLFPLSSPQSCDGSVMAYYPRTAEVIYLGGGASNCTSAGQTWTFYHGSWARLTPIATPPGREGAAFTNDSADGYMLLFGGFNATNQKFYGDTWAFNGSNWTKIVTASSPSNRSGAGLAFDAADGYTVLFGGSNSTYCTGPEAGGLGCMKRDTWEYHGRVWTLLSPAGLVPPEPNDDGLTYDASDGSVLYTVTDDNFSYSDPEIYWSFHSGNWTDLNNWSLHASKLVPINRMGEGLTYDWADGYVVLFGGSNLYFASLSDTWIYHGGTWTNVTTYSAAIFPSPPATDVGVPVVLKTSVVGGGTGPFHYAYSGLPPGCASSDAPTISCTATSAGDYSPTVVVANATAVTTTANVPLIVNPLPRISSFTVSPAVPTLGEPMSLDVVVSDGTPPEALYEYSQLPPGCTSSSTANLTCTPTATGGYAVHVLTFDTVGSAAMQNLSVVIRLTGSGTGATITSFRANPGYLALGETTQFEIATSGGTLPLIYRYLNVPPGCTAGTGASWACTPTATGSYGVTAVVTDASSQSDQLSTPLVVGESGSGAGSRGALSLVAFFASPAIVAVGSSTVLEVISSGGVSPFKYSYTGLPPGCRNQSTEFLECVPGATGNYTIGVTVRDQNDSSVSASALVEVVPTSTAPNQGYSGPPLVWVDAGLGISAVGLAVAAAAIYMVTRSRPPAKRE